MEQEIEIDNVQLKFFHTRSHPFNTTLIFLHDSLGCIELWRDFPKILADQTYCNLLIYDRQGYGKSSAFNSNKRDIYYLEKEADTLNKIITKLEITSVILFGHSDGGSISIITAAKYPEKIKGIITEGAHVFVEDITLQGIQAAVQAYKKTNLKDKLARYHGDKVEKLFYAWTDTWLSTAYKAWNIEHFLSTIDCPVLVIQGEQDEYGSTLQVDSIITNVKGVGVAYVIPNAGHSPHKEAREKTLLKSVEFIHNHVHLKIPEFANS